MTWQTGQLIDELAPRICRRKVLIVDDSRVAMMQQQALLDGKGFEVYTAGDGEEGVEVALREQPDLILLDLMMPRMDGFEALKILRAEQATRHTPILIVTSQEDRGRIREGYRLGCTGYLTKPIDGPLLMEKIDALLD